MGVGDDKENGGSGSLRLTRFARRTGRSMKHTQSAIQFRKEPMKGEGCHGPEGQLDSLEGGLLRRDAGPGGVHLLPLPLQRRPGRRHRRPRCRLGLLSPEGIALRVVLVIRVGVGLPRGKSITGFSYLKNY